MGLRVLVSRYAREGHRRTVVKTALYRVLMLLVTVGVALAVTGRVEQALSIGVVTNVIKTGTYYAYERGWAHVTWGA